MSATLSSLFAPGCEEDFLRHFADKEFAVLPGNAGAIGELLSIEEIGALLASGALRADRVRVLRTGNQVPDMLWAGSDGLADMATLQNLMAKGATLVANDIGLLIPNVRDVEHSVERRLGSRTLVNAYFTQASGGAFPAHYDNHDVLVIQVRGDKTWEIFAPAERPGKSQRKWHHEAPPPSDVMATHRLQPGEMMFLPRGTWHRAKVSDGGESLHLSVTIVSRTGLDYLKWAIERSAGDDLLGSDIPRFAGTESVLAYERALGEHVVRSLGIHNLSEFLAADDGTRLPVALDGFSARREPAKADVIIPALRRKAQPPAGTSGAKNVRASDRTHRIEACLRAVFDAVDASEVGLAYGELTALLSPNWSEGAVADAVGKLASKGLVAIRRSGAADDESR